MSIMVAVGSFGLAVVLHGIAARIPLRTDAVRRFLLVGMPLGGGLLLYSVATLGFTTYAFAPILLYAFLCELYIFCFTLVISSVSVTMLIMLRRGPISSSSLTSAYDPRGMVSLRLERLIKQGFIVREGEHLAITATGMRLNQAFDRLQRFFRHSPR